MVKGIIRDTYTGIVNADGYCIPLAVKGYIKLTTFYVVFDAVFYQVKNDLVEIILKKQNRAIATQIHRELNTVVICHPGEHAHYLLNGRTNINGSVFPVRMIFNSGKSQKSLRHSIQTIGLLADVCYKFHCGFRICAVLQD